MDEELEPSEKIKALTDLIIALCEENNLPKQAVIDDFVDQMNGVKYD
jgi:hypothetical protein